MMYDSFPKPNDKIKLQNPYLKPAFVITCEGSRQP
jgi:hypothetical protein